MTTTVQTDKKAESIQALKNANKHLTDLFSRIDKKDLVLAHQASCISYVAKQCGDLHIFIYVGSERKPVSLKTYLEAAATALNEAR